ncbi:PDZ domain-containing protein, partial [Bacillus subtilis]
GKPMEVKVVLDSDEGSATKAEKLSESLLGATISNAIVSNTKGVQIDNVAPKSPAALVGLVKGDLIFGVNDARVENIEQFRKIIE